MSKTVVWLVAAALCLLPSVAFGTDIQAWLGLEDGMHPALAFLLIALATLISEDLTAIYAGVLISQGDISMAVGLGGTFTGIWLGDIGLWLVGRGIERGALSWGWAQKRIEGQRLQKLSEWYRDQGWRVILVSRMVPATRLPLYLGRRLPWVVVAQVCAVDRNRGGPVDTDHRVSGHVAWPHAHDVLGDSIWAIIATLVAGYVILQLVMLATSADKRRKLARRWRRWSHHEYWPTLPLYLPVICYWGPRHSLPQPARGVSGQPEHSRWRHSWRSQVPDTRLHPPSSCTGMVRDPNRKQQKRRAALEAVMAERGWSWPLILKPDQGERGAAVRKIRDIDSADAYLASIDVPVIAQVFHPGRLRSASFTTVSRGPLVAPCTRSPIKSSQLFLAMANEHSASLSMRTRASACKPRYSRLVIATAGIPSRRLASRYPSPWPATTAKAPCLRMANTTAPPSWRRRSMTSVAACKAFILVALTFVVPPSMTYAPGETSPLLSSMVSPARAPTSMIQSEVRCLPGERCVTNGISPCASDAR